MKLLSKLADTSFRDKKKSPDRSTKEILKNKTESRTQDSPLRMLILVLCFSIPFSFSLPAFTTDDETDREIENLKLEIKRIQKQHEKEIEELNKRIEELEAKSKEEKEYAEPVKPQEEVDEPATKTFVTEWWKYVEVGYSSGFFMETKDDLFSLKINFRSQFQFFVEDEDSDTQTGFDIRRLWISFRGNAFLPWLKYLVILEASGDVELLDYILDFAKFTEAVPRAGQYRVPFNREELTDPFNLQLVDNSIVNREFSLGRDVGAGIGGVVGRFLTYEVGIFNGDGRNSISDNSNLLYVGRVMFTPTGQPRYSSINPFPVSGDYTYSQGSFDNPEIPLIAVSTAFAYLPGFKPAEKSPDNAFINDRVISLGSVKSDIFQFSTDLSIKYLIFSLEAEYDLRNINPNEAGIDSLLSQGIRIQSGIFIVPRTLEVAGRFALIDLDNDSDDDRIWEITPGVSFYFLKNHSLKLQFDYSFIRDEFLDIDTNRFRTQLTVSF
ncbi:MAG TPA: porin [Thermodesulfobacteriota bacterium]|nr:porin [Thermodesulfobacteriota bacterium]